jgi:hypothetical protein
VATPYLIAATRTLASRARKCAQTLLFYRSGEPFSSAQKSDMMDGGVNMKPNVRALSITVAAALLVFVSVSLRAGQAAVDISGAWIFSVDTGTVGTPTVTFKQEGEKLTGHYSSQTLGEADFTGTLKGQALSFTFTATIQDMPLPVVYTGTVPNKDEMKGTIDIAGGAASGTFTAKRKP